MRPNSGEAGRDRDRIVNLSDGVFAIAITLLVLDIRAPDIPQNMVSSELPGALLSLWPKYLSYVLSFIGISAFWLIHHSILRPIRSYDRILLYLNLMFLMVVAFLPFPTPLPRRVRRPPAACGHLRRHPRRGPAAVDGPALALYEGRSAARRTSGPRHGSLLPQTGSHDTDHFLALHRHLVFQRQRGHLYVVGDACCRYRRDPQEVSIGRLAKQAVAFQHVSRL